MSIAIDAEFCHLLRKDIEYLTRGIERFEDLLPYASAAVQDQWRLQAQARRIFTMELEILLEKATHSVATSAFQASRRDHSESASW